MVMTSNGSYNASIKNGRSKNPDSVSKINKKTKKLFVEYEKTKSAVTRNRIVENYIPFVEQVVAKSFRKNGGLNEKEDVIQEGLISLLESIPRYDSSRGASFSTFVYKNIKGSINDSLRKLDWAPRLARQRNKKINQAYQSLRVRSIEPTKNNIINEIGISERDYLLFMKDKDTSRLFSLDGMVNEGRNYPYLNKILENKVQKTPLEEIERKDFWEYITSGFSRREIAIIKSLYIRESTMKGTASLIKLSESRISQINSSILRRLKSREVLEFF